MYVDYIRMKFINRFFHFGIQIFNIAQSEKGINPLTYKSCYLRRNYQIVIMR